MLNFEISEDNGHGYRHYTYCTRFVSVTITENIKASEFEVNIHPNTDKGYRDPFELVIFKNLNVAKQFAEEYFKADI